MSSDLSYIGRISDEELKRKLNASGALLIRGMKACGKTHSANQLAASKVSFDQDAQVPLLMETVPQRLLLARGFFVLQLKDNLRYGLFLLSF